MKIKISIILLISTLMQVKGQPIKIAVPLGGNSFVTAGTPNSKDEVSNKGWINWQQKETVFSTYIYVEKAGTLSVAATFVVPDGKSKIACRIAGITKYFTPVSNKEVEIGEWNITTAGYVKIDMQGIDKTGNIFASVDSLMISGTAVTNKTAFVKSNEGNYFYWGRRGPSVHLNYDISQVNGDIEWFYNEITVPKQNDVIGSYFMADGFAEGYFGMQVNSATERRILFSVWSPFNTDDPKQIPDDKKIKLLKKGADVHTGEFGNEGSGGQSYLKYNWKAGETYKFLIQAVPVENNYTNYTAYFYAAEKKQWLLLASFSRPATHTHLTKLHSFLENFEPETGYITRMANYKNQWVKTVGGDWQAINKATFTYDATAKKEYRLDYSGAENQGSFILRNCGFFNEHTSLKTVFTHSLKGDAPNINLEALNIK